MNAAQRRIVVQTIAEAAGILAVTAAVGFVLTAGTVGGHLSHPAGQTVTATPAPDVTVMLCSQVRTDGGFLPHTDHHSCILNGRRDRVTSAYLTDCNNSSASDTIDSPERDITAAEWAAFCQ